MSFSLAVYLYSLSIEGHLLIVPYSQHFQGLRRAQNKADSHPPPAVADSPKKFDPTLNPITRRPGPGRGRPRKHPATAVDGAAVTAGAAPAAAGQPGVGQVVPGVPGVVPAPPGVAVSPVPVPVIPGTAPVPSPMAQGIPAGQGLGMPQPQMIPQGAQSHGQMSMQAVPAPQGQQFAANHINQGQPRPMAVGQIPPQAHHQAPRAVNNIGIAPQAQMDGPEELAVDPNLQNDEDEDDEDEVDDLAEQAAKRPRLDDSATQDDPSNQLGDEEQALLSSLGGHNNQAQGDYVDEE